MVISKYTDLVDFENKYRWLVATGLSFLLFVDVVNTVALCVYLRIERTGSSSRIDSILNKMFLWTLGQFLIVGMNIGISADFSSLYRDGTNHFVCYNPVLDALVINECAATGSLAC